jgi:hypothetical protein
MGLWSSARYDLRLTEAEFWKMTDRQLAALMRRRRVEIESRQYQAGILASTFANFSMAHPKEPLSPEDFMPSRKVKEPSDDDIAEKFAASFACIALKPGVPTR